MNAQAGSSKAAGPSQSPAAHGPVRAPRARVRPRCPQCGSRRFRRDGASGLVVCQEGHVLQGFREEYANEEEGGAGAAAAGGAGVGRATTRVRRKRKGRRAKQRTSTVSGSRIYGQHAAFRGYQCLQLMLRLQLEALRSIFPGLPHAQVEAVAREYFTLFLHVMEHDDGDDSDGGDDDRASDDSTVSRPQKRARRYRLAAMPLEDPVSPSQSEWDSASDAMSAISGYSSRGSSRYASQASVGPSDGGYSSSQQSISSRSTASRSRSRSQNMADAARSALLARQRALQGADRDNQQDAKGKARRMSGSQTPAEHESADEDGAPRVEPQSSTRKARRLSVFRGYEPRWRTVKTEPISGSDAEDDDDDDDEYAMRGASASSDGQMRSSSRGASSSRRRRGTKLVGRAGQARDTYAKMIKRSALLDNTLSIIYLTLWTLRVPLLLADLRRLLVSRCIPYLGAAGKHHSSGSGSGTLPRALVEPLSYAAAHYFGLHATSVPSTENIYNAAQGFARQVAAVASIALPSFNAAPALWACTKRMLLPPSVYLIAKSLLVLCDFQPYLSRAFLTLAISEGEAEAGSEVDEKAAVDGDGKDQTPEDTEDKYATKRAVVSALTTRTMSLPREAILVAAIVVVMKMRYGLDGVKRFENAQYPSGMPHFASWLDVMQKATAAIEADPSAAYQLNMDVLDMNDAQLDSFLSHAEEKLVDRRDHESQRAKSAHELQQFLDIDPQPTPDASRMELDVRERELQRALASLYGETPPAKPLPASASTSKKSSVRLECGQGYRTYVPRTTDADEPGALPEDLQLVLEIAARTIDCDISTVNTALWHLEDALRWKLRIPNAPMVVHRGASPSS